MKMLKLLGGISAVVLTASVAQAGPWTSTFNVDHHTNGLGADFLVDNFGGATTAHFNASNLLGGFDQEVPPAGGFFDVFFDINFAVDLDGDGIDDMTSSSGPSLLSSNAQSPGPGTNPFVFNYVDLPDFTFVDPNTGLPIVLSGLTLDGVVTIGSLNGNGPGSFGSGDNIDFTITDATGTLNFLLQSADVDGNGFFNGFFTGDGSVDFASVPLPSSLFLGLGLFGGLGIVTLIRRRA